MCARASVSSSVGPCVCASASLCESRKDAERCGYRPRRRSPSSKRSSRGPSRTAPRRCGRVACLLVCLFVCLFVRSLFVCLRACLSVGLRCAAASDGAAGHPCACARIGSDTHRPLDRVAAPRPRWAGAPEPSATRPRGKHKQKRVAIRARRWRARSRCHFAALATRQRRASERASE